MTRPKGTNAMGRRRRDPVVVIDVDAVISNHRRDRSYSGDSVATSLVVHDGMDAAGSSEEGSLASCFDLWKLIRSTTSPDLLSAEISFSKLSPFSIEHNVDAKRDERCQADVRLSRADFNKSRPLSRAALGLLLQFDHIAKHESFAFFLFRFIRRNCVCSLYEGSQACYSCYQEDSEDGHDGHDDSCQILSGLSEEEYDKSLNWSNVASDLLARYHIFAKNKDSFTTFVLDYFKYGCACPLYEEGQCYKCFQLTLRTRANRAFGRLSDPSEKINFENYVRVLEGMLRTVLGGDISEEEKE